MYKEMTYFIQNVASRSFTRFYSRNIRQNGKRKEFESKMTRASEFTNIYLKLEMSLVLCLASYFTRELKCLYCSLDEEKQSLFIY